MLIIIDMEKVEKNLEKTDDMNNRKWIHSMKRIEYNAFTRHKHMLWAWIRQLCAQQLFFSSFHSHHIETGMSWMAKCTVNNNIESLLMERKEEKKNIENKNEKKS